METTTTTTTKVQHQKKKRWVISLSFSLLLSSLLILTSILASNHFFLLPFSLPITKPIFIESKLRIDDSPSKNSIPRIAYLISGSIGDGESIKRILKALYHPLNQYAVHLDLEASVTERLSLGNFVESEPVFAQVGNVHFVVKANLVTYRGPTMVSNTLHAAAILMKKDREWDWFINLSASDYPLVTQDGKKFLILKPSFFYLFCALLVFAN